MQVGYQGDRGKDNDPMSEPYDAGITYTFEAADSITIAKNGQVVVPQGGFGSLVLLETVRDTNIEHTDRLLKKIVVPHEIGHQFGLRGDAAGFGIMTSNAAPDALTFVPSHLDLLRWRVKSPGQR